MRNRIKSILELTLAIALPAIALIAYTQYQGVDVGAQNVATTTPTLATSTTNTVSTSTVTISNPITQNPPTPVSAYVPSQTTTTSGTNQSVATQPKLAQNSPSGWYYVFVAPDDYHKNPGSMISFTGNHFYPNELVTITQSSGTRIGSVQANSAGALKTDSFVVPYTSGTIKYVFTGSVSQIPFTVNVKVGNENPWITLSSYYAGSDQPVTVAGHSFGSYEQVTIWFGDTNLGTVSTDVDGAFSLRAVVPPGNTSQKTVRAVATRTHSSASQSFSQAF
ncbi:MAG: hypothetical protein M3Q63_03805 [bacterium]|nr:hypothetical protein [bacterium]